MVYLLPVEGLPGLELPLVPSYEANPGGTTPHGDVVRENICSRNTAVKFPSDGAVIPLVIIQDLVEFDRCIGRRKRLG